MGEWFKFFVLQKIAKHVIPEPFNYFFFQLFIRNMQFSTSTFGLLQCHDIYAAIEIGLDCRSLDESHLI